MQAEANLLTELCGKVDQGVKREAGDTVMQEVVGMELVDVGVLRNLSPGPAALLDQGCELLHQFRPYPEVGGFCRCIGSRIPDAGVCVILVRLAQRNFSHVLMVNCVRTAACLVRHSWLQHGKFPGHRYLQWRPSLLDISIAGIRLPAGGGGTLELRLPCRTGPLTTMGRCGRHFTSPPQRGQSPRPRAQA